MSVTIDRNGTSVTLTNDLSVDRSVGRPEAHIRPSSTSDRGDYVDPPKPAVDMFEISAETNPSDGRKLQEDIVLPALGRDNLTLSFNNGLYSYTSNFSVFPAIGRQSCRVSYAAGQTDQVRLDTIKLRIVDNS